MASHWYPVNATRYVPMWVLDIVRIVHGFEALLAMLAIAIWHMYNVHFNPGIFPMSKIWLTGKISGHELRTMHRLEYDELWAQRAQQLGKTKGNDLA